MIDIKEIADTEETEVILENMRNQVNDIIHLIDLLQWGLEIDLRNASKIRMMEVHLESMREEIGILERRENKKE